MEGRLQVFDEGVCRKCSHYLRHPDHVWHLFLLSHLLSFHSLIMAGKLAILRPEMFIPAAMLPFSSRKCFLCALCALCGEYFFYHKGHEDGFIRPHHRFLFFLLHSPPDLSNFFLSHYISL